MNKISNYNMIMITSLIIAFIITFIICLLVKIRTRDIVLVCGISTLLVLLLENVYDADKNFTNFMLNTELPFLSKPQKNNINSGMGSLGQLKKPMNEDVFLDYIKDKLNLKVIRYSKKLNKKISTISILVGSGSFAIKDSIEKKSDVFITSDLKYHNFFEGNNELLLVDIGHYESENHIKTIIKEFLIEKLPNFTVLLSEQNINPVNYK